ncbi:acetylcholinesterase-like [Cydia amplana]|uniref:acetylcholinesterase-like n=1 Tax=Cydia amplana TaxID=1869771 RepID=UPI002FE591AF
MLSTKWLVLWSLWAARLARQPTAPLRVSSGLLRGSIAHDGSHLAYLSVPYATVNSRFQAPGPEPKWDGIFEAYDENVKCTQRLTSSIIMGQEDCLVLNVYTPPQSSHPQSPLPVLVFIHGGGFRDGSGSPFLYGPEYLVKHGVILVTFNYRLEILGFLCLGTKDAPGNAGLKDQVAALRWIQKNIKAFGGDRDNVTIFGESAGSASVSYHLISPMSKGLFHKAVMQSGTAMSPWSFQFEPLQIAKSYVQQFGYTTDNTNEIYKALMTKSSQQLMKTRVPRKEGDIVLSENIFVPCVEKKIPGVELFLPEKPFTLISKGDYHKVPIIIGYNNAEGYMFTAKENDTTIAQLDFSKALPRDLDLKDEEEKRAIADKLKQLYMGDKAISKKTIEEFSHYEGDSGITYPVLATIDLLLKTSTEPIFTYRLDYDGWLNVAKFFCGWGTAPGATHADELFYMFKPLFPTAYLMEQDIVDVVSRMWTNFAKFGNPTPAPSSRLPKWPPSTRTDARLLVIDKHFHYRPLWEEKAMTFWNQTYHKFRRK